MASSRGHVDVSARLSPDTRTEKSRHGTRTILFLEWPMMHGGITPKFQPLDGLINKIVKVFS